MDREEICEEQIRNLENRIEVCDSALILKTEEATHWHSTALETDKSLEEADIKFVEENHKNKRNRKISFGVGAVLGWVIGILI